MRGADPRGAPDARLGLPGADLLGGDFGDAVLGEILLLLVFDDDVISLVLRYLLLLLLLLDNHAGLVDFVDFHEVLVIAEDDLLRLHLLSRSLINAPLTNYH